eukprot:3273579-Amphidinium_carterae.1
MCLELRLHQRTEAAQEFHTINLAEGAGIFCVLLVSPSFALNVSLEGSNRQTHQFGPFQSWID